MSKPGGPYSAIHKERRTSSCYSAYSGRRSNRSPRLFLRGESLVTLHVLFQKGTTKSDSGRPHVPESKRVRVVTRVRLFVTAAFVVLLDRAQSCTGEEGKTRKPVVADSVTARTLKTPEFVDTAPAPPPYSIFLSPFSVALTGEKS